MKKQILFASGLAVALMASAVVYSNGLTSDQNENAGTDTRYCMLIVYQGVASDKSEFSMNFGQQRSDIWEKNTVKTMEGQIIVFNEEVDVMNYLADQGWKYLNTNTITVKSYHITRYVFVKAAE